MFPYCSLVVESGNTNPADFLLACTTRGVCDAYQNVILNIPRLSTNSTKQLITDIGKTALKKMNFTTVVLPGLFSKAYLGDIMEDLGHPLSEGLPLILSLLKLPPCDYWMESAGMPQKLVSTIRQIRNLC